MNNDVDDFSCGIVPIHRSRAVVKYLIIQHNDGHWGFPKGHPEAGETEQETACREFTEETGISEFTIIGSDAISENYSFSRKNQRVHKTVQYYPATVVDPTVRIQQKEVLDYRWLEIDEALSILTFEESRHILRQVAALETGSSRHAN